LSFCRSRNAADTAALEEWAGTEAETFPAVLADALIAGESAVRAFRRHRGLTQTDLALKAAISVPYLNQIEAGKRKPSVVVLKRVATALNVPVEALVY
jgi:DNA-binding XRE family transcriptional regulator